ncbi:MAG: hypothetical protein ABMA14_04930 [Hyphomonadaceae bacterium]
MKTRIGVAAVIVAARLTAACGSGVASNIPKRDLPIPDTTLLTSRDDLRIAPLDVVEIKVFGVADLNGAYQVNPTARSNSR